MICQNNNEKRRSVALGFFDGLHRAHMAVINSAAAHTGDGISPAVLLFDKNPRQVLSGRLVPLVLQREERDKILAGLGIEPINTVFEAVRNMTPEKFVFDFLSEKLNAAFVSCGFNYTFGLNGTGNAERLIKLCGQCGIKTVVCPEMKDGDEVISSSAIRNAVEAGNIRKANAMLGRPFFFSSRVVHGENRGHLLGAPTVNQLLPEGLVVPRTGVYASRARIHGREYNGVTNIGVRPTFDGRELRSETFILSFSGNLYGETVELELFDFLRGERKFPSLEGLKKQIAADAEAAKKLLEH